MLQEYRASNQQLAGPNGFPGQRYEDSIADRMVELAEQYKSLPKTMPWLNVFGGCCGADLRHLPQITCVLTGR
jgi:methionine synthase I (cobalamin-dependent)